MKTKEFIERVEALEFVNDANIPSGSSYINIFSVSGECIACVRTDNTLMIDTDYRSLNLLKPEEQKQLFDLLVEYASTPLEEREEEINWLKSDMKKAKEYIAEKFKSELECMSRSDLEDYINCGNGEEINKTIIEIIMKTTPISEMVERLIEGM